MSTGLSVTATQKPYSFELSTKELISHKAQLDDYKEELSQSLYQSAIKYKPNLDLINQQPEVKPYLRSPILEFLLKISVRTKVTNGIYYQAVKIFDRYSSKRIVLRDQLQLVLGTCLWLSAKVYGGCNHVINNTNVPPGGRFHGPTPRARVPRLSELVQLCGASSPNLYDEGMFVQMERHILDTLNWDICEPSFNNWILNFYENNYIQLKNHNYENSFQDKLEIINIKTFISEVSLFELQLVEVHPSTIAQTILNIISKFYPDYNLSSDLIIPEDYTSFKLNYYQSLIIDQILASSEFIKSHYFELPGVKSFYEALVASLINNDNQSGSPSSPSSISISSTFSNTNNSTFSSIPNTPQITKKTFIPTPPSSRRGSPTGTIFDIKNGKKFSNNPQTNGTFSTPLTPFD